MLVDPEMADIAKEELKELEPKLPDLEQAVKIALIPKEKNG